MLVAKLPTHHSGIQGVPPSSITDSPPYSIAAHLHPSLCPVSPSSQTGVTIIAWWVYRYQTTKATVLRVVYLISITMVKTIYAVGVVALVGL